MEPLSFRILPEAVGDVDEIVAYYETQRAGLGKAFDDEVTRKILQICSSPTSGSYITADTRICRTHRFPYGIVYQRQAAGIVVLSVLHLSRDPEGWTERLHRE
jgi:plasmid stabilization system protein ParE